MSDQAYFPAISQAEGLPMKIQDITGKEWVFQFRFWPNNNSRMYVLEGVTPCIQSMQLQAGDTGMLQLVLLARGIFCFNWTDDVELLGFSVVDRTLFFSVEELRSF
jgi:hypothetical protein